MNSLHISTYIPLIHNVSGWPSWVPDLGKGSEIREAGQEILWHTSDNDLAAFRDTFQLNNTGGMLILKGMLLSRLIHVGFTCPDITLGDNELSVGKVVHHTAIVL